MDKVALYSHLRLCDEHKRALSDAEFRERRRGVIVAMEMRIRARREQEEARYAERIRRVFG